ncbi:MAG: NUDIX domain-containing protein [Anaerolineales bacterium]|nr:NUDIX domain-containing protein [Anaerolineales bacterium]
MRHRNRRTFPSAVHLFLVKEGKLLLLRRKNTGYMDGSLSVVAGHLGGDETVYAAAKREALEEAGIRLEEQDLAIVGVMHRREDDERIDWFLTASRWSGQISNAEPEKCEELVWHPLAELPPDIIPYVRRGIDNYIAGKAFESFGFH